MEADVQQAWLISPSGMGKSCQKRPTSTVAVWGQLLLAGLRAAGLGKATYSQVAWPGGSCRGQGRSAGVPFLTVNYYLYALSGLFPQFFLQNADLLAAGIGVTSHNEMSGDQLPSQAQHSDQRC